MTYDLSDYGRMLADDVRMDAYAYALKAAVTPDSIVLDIGAATGIHALLACKFGARRVYAVEPNDAIHLAREIAAANGFDDRIDFIQGLSSRISLPEPADIIVSDMRGALPLFGQHIPSIVDARQRHLAPGGQLIPRHDTLWAALVEARDVYREVVRPWRVPYGLNMEPAKEIALNRWETADADTIRSGHLLTDPHRWAVLDYTAIQSPDVAADISLPATRNGTAHGWLVWFDAQLTDEIAFSNGPEQRKFAEVYGRAFFPLLEPVPVVEGDIVRLAIDARLVGGEYIWDWASRVHPHDDPKTVKAQFEQSTSFEGVLDARHLAKYVAGQRPALDREGEIDRFILSNMDGRATIDEIADRLQALFPDHFEKPQEAIVYIHQLAQQYQ
jgi:protein arginine N-methyltransferase 1